tara:strand:- start:394 stop:876 length:483 start_codon:yes stop_codon:yes gene_type:complete
MLKYVNGEIESKAIMFRGNKLQTDMYVKYRAIELLEAVLDDIMSLMQQLTPMSDDKLKDMMKAQYTTIVSWRKPNQLEMQYNFSEIFKKLNDLIPGERSNLMDIEPKQRKVKIDKFEIGTQFPENLTQYFNFERFRDLFEIKNQTNKREGMSHYPQSLEL